MANSGRDYIGFNVDISGPTAVNAFLQQVSMSMRTPAHIGPVLKYAHAELSDEFNKHMSNIAPTRQSEFHHVYEWYRVGDQSAQLWKNVLRGGGNNRTATFEWRASKSIVPVRPDAIARNVDGSVSSNATLPKQIHVFVWKAPVMEYSKDLSIAPKRGKFIVYFTGPWTTNQEYYENVHFSSAPITVSNPGGKRVKGALTVEYVRWWSKGGAAEVFNNRLNKVMSMNTKKMAEMGLASANSRSRSRSFNMKVMGNQRTAVASGKAAAKQAMSRLSNNYIEAAKQREAFGFSDD